MANCAFGYPVYSDPSVLQTPIASGGSYVATLPLSNIFDRRLAKVARTTDATAGASTFDVDLGQARDVGVLAILLPNITKSSTPTIRWKGSTVANFATTVYDSGALQVWPSGVTAEDADGLNVWTPTLPTTVQTARYWRCAITDTANVDGHIDIARVLIAGRYTPAQNFSYGYGQGLDTDSVRTVTDGGAAIYQEKRQRRTHSLTFESIAQAEAFASPYQLQRRQGITRQLYFVADPADTTYLWLRSYLCVLKQLSALQLPKPSQFTMGFELIEEL